MRSSIPHPGVRALNPLLPAAFLLILTTSTLAQTPTNRVAAAGYNVCGQLGVSNNDYSPRLALIDSVVSIAGGQDCSLAVRSDGSVWAWGYNSRGQLGDGTTTTRRTPVQVSNLIGVIAAATAGGGTQCLALKADGTVWAWGHNKAGSWATARPRLN